MSETNTYADQLIETLIAAADQLHDEVDLPLSVIADAMHLGCGIPHSVFGLEVPTSDYRPEPPGSDSSAVRTLGLIGAGTMSQGIARAALQAGIDVCIVARDPGRAARAGSAVIAEIQESTARIVSSSDVEALVGVDSSSRRSAKISPVSNGSLLTSSGSYPRTPSSRPRPLASPSATSHRP